MKKELGKWLIDIAKYITIAVVVMGILHRHYLYWALYIGAPFTVVITLLAGLWLVRDNKKGE